METIFYYKFPVGEVGIIEEAEKISWVFFHSRADRPKHRDSLTVSETPLIKKTARQLNEYFEHKRKTFDLPLYPQGTSFQLSVWKSLCQIPYGKTLSYKEIAKMAGNTKACRAVGMANNRNPIAIIIPCHRVIGSNGSLTGYGGGLDIKQYLLELENPNVL